MIKLLITLVLTATSAAGAAANFTFSNSPGPYGVGLRVSQLYDHSRVYKAKFDPLSGLPVEGERARPIQAMTWYPADAKGKPVSYRDYLVTVGSEEDFSRSAGQLARLADSWIAEVSARPHLGQARAALALPMRAVRDAPPRQGKFPVVVYAPSFSATAIENTDLCEYLASQGYIVLSSPSIGARTRAMTSNLEGLEAQAGDIAFLVATAHALPQADTSRIAVVGFSWGGLANVLAAAKDDRIRALVSLDGSLRGFPEFVNGGKDAARYVTPARLAVPLLYVARRPMSMEEINKREVDTTWNLINQMKYSDIYLVTMRPMAHMDFSSKDLRVAPDSNFEEYSRDEVSVAHSWTARYVHQFLDAYLKNDKAAHTFINNSAAANKAPRHMMTLDIRRGAAPPATFDTFVGIMGKRGFHQAIAAYQELQAKDAAFQLGDRQLNLWGYQLLGNGKEKEAVEIFKLATHLYPKAGFIFDSLAEAQEKTGDQDEAIKNYRRSLELDPGNVNAVNRLKALGAAI